MTKLTAIVGDRATEISSRFEDRDGRLFVGPSVLTRAGVDSYYGEEVTGWQDLGLDPKRQYRFLRSPEALKAAVPRMGGVLPLTTEHVSLTAHDHDDGKVIGAVGSDVRYNDDDDTVTGSLSVWREPFIGRIKSREQREISMGYRFRPVMTPGVWRGKPYDGVFEDIEPNHFALVPAGRVNIDSDGPLAAVADAANTGGKPVADTNPLEGLIECLRAFAPDKDDDALRAAATQFIAALNAPAVEGGAGDEGGEDKTGEAGDEGCEMGRAGDEGQGLRDREDEARGEDDKLERERKERERREREGKVGDSAIRQIEARVMSRFAAIRSAENEIRGVVGQAAMVGDSAGDLYRNALRSLGVPDAMKMGDDEAARTFRREKARRNDRRATVGDSVRQRSTADLSALGFGKLLPPAQGM